MGRGKQHRTYPNDDAREKEKVLKAKDKKIEQLEKEIIRLKNELKTLNKAFEKTGKYIKGNLDNVTVEKIIFRLNSRNNLLYGYIISGVKSEITMVEIKAQNGCPQCGAETKTMNLPFGKINICSSACGWRDVNKD